MKERVKRVVKAIEKILNNPYFCAALLAVTFVYGAYFISLSSHNVPIYKSETVSKSVFDISLSNLGRIPQYTARYYVFCLLTVTTFLVAVPLMYRRSECKGLNLFVGYALLFVATVTMLITTFVLEPRSGIRAEAPLPFDVHHQASIIYGISVLFTQIPPFIAKRKDKRYLLLALIVWPIFLVDVPLMIKFNAVAFTEFYPMSVGYVLMFLINCTSLFEPKKQTANDATILEDKVMGIN